MTILNKSSLGGIISGISWISRCSSNSDTSDKDDEHEDDEDTDDDDDRLASRSRRRFSTLAFVLDL